MFGTESSHKYATPLSNFSFALILFSKRKLITIKQMIDATNAVTVDTLHAIVVAMDAPNAGEYTHTHAHTYETDTAHLNANL